MSPALKCEVCGHPADAELSTDLARVVCLCTVHQSRLRRPTDHHGGSFLVEMQKQPTYAAAEKVFQSFVRIEAVLWSLEGA